MSLMLVRGGVFLALLPAILACSGRPPEKVALPGGAKLGSTGIATPVVNSRHCVSGPLEPRRLKAQILVDVSGSMVGFRQALPTLASWGRQAVSQLATNSATLEDFRVCAFSAPLGIGQCSGFGTQVPSWEPRGETNLDQAIREGASFDLTVVITDGVAATGVAGTKGCASGVDAACVARALREFVHGEGYSTSAPDRSVHLLPLVADYSGPFFTEKAMPDPVFPGQQIVSTVQADTGIAATVQNPQVKNGTLVYDYTGPRALVALVLSKSSVLGRDAVQALVASTGTYAIRLTDTLRVGGPGLWRLEPMELYPGFLGQVRWNTLQAPTKRSDVAGTISVRLEADRPLLTVRCSGKPGEGIYTLAGVPETADRASGCVDIQQVPLFSATVTTADPQALVPAQAVLASFKIEETGPLPASIGENLGIHLRCPNTTLPACGSGNLELRWTSAISYRKAADLLALAGSGQPGSGGAAPAVASLVHLTTIDGGAEPHKVYNLRATVEQFLREVSEDRKSSIVSSFGLCR